MDQLFEKACKTTDETIVEVLREKLYDHSELISKRTDSHDSVVLSKSEKHSTLSSVDYSSYFNEMKLRVLTDDSEKEHIIHPVLAAAGGVRTPSATDFDDRLGVLYEWTPAKVSISASGTTADQIHYEVRSLIDICAVALTVRCADPKYRGQIRGFVEKKKRSLNEAIESFEKLEKDPASGLFELNPEELEDSLVDMIKSLVGSNTGLRSELVNARMSQHCFHIEGKSILSNDPMRTVLGSALGRVGIDIAKGMESKCPFELVLKKQEREHEGGADSVGLRL